MKKLIISLLLVGMISCSPASKQSNTTPTNNSNTVSKLQGVGYALILPAAMVGIIIGLLI